MLVSLHTKLNQHKLVVFKRLEKFISLALQLLLYPHTIHHTHTHTHTHTLNIMALETRLKAPNGTEFTLPTGLFINNEFVASSAGIKITSVSPA